MNKKPRYLSARAGAMMVLGDVLMLALLAAAGLALYRGALPWWLCAGAALLSALLFAAQYLFLYRPYREAERILRLFASGYTLEGLFEQPISSTPATRGAIAHVRQMVSGGELLSASRREAQVLALQNQINPHFLYNTLEGIRGEALVSGNSNIADMTEALSTFFRYTISNLEHMVTLEEELANIENYFAIQQYRFGERISLEILFDSEADRRLLMGEKMPKLTLQPVVENAIIHGIEGKVGPGKVRLLVRGTEKRLLIRVADDGLGIDREQLDALNAKLTTLHYEEEEKARGRKGGIGIVNVNNRIRLLFGEAYGLVVFSTPGGGTDVEITLPRGAGAREEPHLGEHPARTGGAP